MIIRKWIGKYWFTGNLPETFINSETKFEIEIDTFNNKKISGIVFDHLDMGGTPGNGTISGFIKGDTIKFTKKMPIKTLVLPDGTRIEKQKPHRPIYYQGIINHKTNTIKGTWRFKKGIGLLDRKIVFYSGTKGEWEMKKV